MTLHLSLNPFYGIMVKDSCEINSEVEYFLDVEGAVGSNPSSRTIWLRAFVLSFFIYRRWIKPIILGKLRVDR